MRLMARYQVTSNVTVSTGQSDPDWTSNGDKLHFASGEYEPAGPYEEACLEVLVEHGYASRVDMTESASLTDDVEEI